MSADRMDVSQVREKLAEVLKRVEETRRPVVLECAGREVGALVPMHTYRVLIEAREARFDALAAAVAQQPQYPEEELEREIAEVLAEIRGRRATSRI
ncbi:MAG TPA: type II toxin-antitoxin system prevent-host-death family antitoxin [Longimicrobium sp.]|uniref:type II toxin-antitoxin system prevent-host-death family antitoxin n=1 Tax=Longimicrobium sp. TaxID=2029185 RepID=UPI002ED92132